MSICFFIEWPQNFMVPSPITAPKKSTVETASFIFVGDRTRPLSSQIFSIFFRMAKMTQSNVASGPPKRYYSVLKQNTTKRAKMTGKANACSGRIFMTVAPGHFGLVLAENDSET
uniref:Uncharacterized protein n=1 Tax=Tanacetum cinerariifolium TaxID=118510 RepID=A0A6L2MVK3_TANCI|nr:hypothetical protein [Tanacetum cinerariifolium]